MHDKTRRLKIHAEPESQLDLVGYDNKSLTQKETYTPRNFFLKHSRYLRNDEITKSPKLLSSTIFIQTYIMNFWDKHRGANISELGKTKKTSIF